MIPRSTHESWKERLRDVGAHSVETAIHVYETLAKEYSCPGDVLSRVRHMDAQLRASLDVAATRVAVRQHLDASE